MGLIHKIREPMEIQKQFRQPLASYRQLYNHLPYPYLRIIHMECHMHQFRPVLQQVQSYPVENIETMLI